MKNNNFPFYSIVLLALALMALIIVTQLFTNQSTRALQKGNIQAVETFKVNNSMQQLVNISFDLQSKLSTPAILDDSLRINSIADSITVLGYSTFVLHRSISGLGYKNLADQIDTLAKQQVDHLLYILTAAQRGDVEKRNALAEALHRLQLGEKVYGSCLKVQEVLEHSLENTLKKNTHQARILSIYNRVLAVVAIIAILILATIIIRRQSDQLKLIEVLKEAELAALRSKSAKDDFVANMSHELRTPLNALIGFSNLLHQTRLDEKQQEYVNVIRSGGYNLLNIVNDVLDLSKIEAGKMKIVNRPFNLRNVLQNLEMMFSEAIAEKHLDFQWQLHDKIPANLSGDPERLKQILINLIGNAIKFTNSGRITLSTEVIPEELPCGMLKISFAVKDTGAGIPKEKLETIFDRFEQLEHVTTRQHGGTGLGLTIVKNLVEKMGGTVSVRSQVGVGSEFCFTCVFESVSSPHKKHEKDAKPGNLSLSNINILAAEDNKANQTLLKHLLGRYQASVTLVENGKDAIAALDEQPYDLVLMDIQMPVMDGYTAVDIIKKEKGLKIPVIAMTAYVSEVEIQKCMDAGFDNYLAKPIEENVLLHLINRYAAASLPSKPASDPKDELSFLKELVGDDPVAINEIIAEMKEQWHLDRADIENALKDNNITEIKRILHRVKSTFSPLGPRHEIYLKVVSNNNNLKKSINKIEPDRINQLIEKVNEYLENLKNVS